MESSVHFIGIIHSPLKDIADCPLQESENAPGALIEIYPAFAVAARNIKAGSEILLFTWFHQADRSVFETKPRNDPNAPLTGVFSTRSPNRPNPIGMHSVKVVSVSDNSIKVEALEALDGTPVIDIKPIL
jgi:tRNA-Thr(GGU) m(6)t(6)A37 methyltransferase TsaA